MTTGLKLVDMRRPALAKEMGLSKEELKALLPVETDTRDLEKRTKQSRAMRNRVKDRKVPVQEPMKTNCLAMESKPILSAPAITPLPGPNSHLKVASPLFRGEPSSIRGIQI
jgi:hypothetical protein